MLFGSGASAGLVDRCRDDDSQTAAAHERHPFLAAYCAQLGRDRLAYAPIHCDDSDGGRRELESLRDEYVALAAPWEQRSKRGHALDVRGPGELRKPDYTRAMQGRRP